MELKENFRYITINLIIIIIVLGTFLNKNSEIKKPMNTSYKKRLFWSKTLLNEIENYYNATYVLKFNLEASPGSAALPMTKMIENPVSRFNLFENRYLRLKLKFIIYF